MKIGLVMAYASVLLMLVATVLAWTDDMLLPSDMMRKGYKVGFPLVANGAIWGNFILISAVLYFIGMYSWQWSTRSIEGALIIGMTVSWGLFYFVYLEGKFPDALAGGGRPISPAGWVTMLYSGVVIAAILLFYVWTSATRMDVLAVGILLFFYIPVANHAVLGWLNSLYSWPWCPRIFAEESTPLRFIIGGEIAVVVATAIKL